MPSHIPDHVYFQQRAEQEALAAAQTLCPVARNAHELIARRYLALSADLEIIDVGPAEGWPPVSRQRLLGRAETYVKSLKKRYDRDTSSARE